MWPWPPDSVRGVIDRVNEDDGRDGEADDDDAAHDQQHLAGRHAAALPVFRRIEAKSAEILAGHREGERPVRPVAELHALADPEPQRAVLTKAVHGRGDGEAGPNLALPGRAVQRHAQTKPGKDTGALILRRREISRESGLGGREQLRGHQGRDRQFLHYSSSLFRIAMTTAV